MAIQNRICSISIIYRFFFFFLCSSFIFSQATAKAIRPRRSTPLAAVIAYLSWRIGIIATTLLWRGGLWTKVWNVNEPPCVWVMCASVWQGWRSGEGREGAHLLWGLLPLPKWGLSNLGNDFHRVQSFDDEIELPTPGGFSFPYICLFLIRYVQFVLPCAQ